MRVFIIPHGSNEKKEVFWFYRLGRNVHLLKQPPLHATVEVHYTKDGIEMMDMFQYGLDLDFTLGHLPDEVDDQSGFTYITPSDADVMDPEPLHQLVRRICRVRAEYLEMMAAAYLKKTNLDVEDVELVEELDPQNHLVKFYYRRRTEHA